MMTLSNLSCKSFKNLILVQNENKKNQSMNEVDAWTCLIF